MNRLTIPAALFTALIHTASAQTVTTSTSAPATDVLASATGGIDTSLFDEDANANHGRGQLFSLPDGAGTQFEITAITVRKSNNQTYVDDTLTLRIFEGTQAQWDTGTGHSTADDGDDYLVDTTVTLLHTEAFTLSGTIINNHYVTFQLATPLVVNENSDFGFLMIYDQGTSASNRFRHREGSTGGRISVTTTGHSTSTRNIHYYIHGTIPGILGTPTIAASASTIDVNDSVDLDIIFDTSAETASLSTPGGSVDLQAIDASDAVPGDGMVTVTDAPTSTFTYEVVLTKAGQDDATASTEVVVNNPVITASDKLITIGNSVTLDIRFDTGADTVSLTTPGGSVDLAAIDAGDTNPNDGNVTVVDSPTSTFLYEVTSTKTGEPAIMASIEVLVADPSTEVADNAFSTAIKADSPLVYYRFEEAANTGFLLDSSGNGHHTADIVGTLGQGSGPGGMQNAGECPGNVGILSPATSTMNQSFTVTAVANLKAGQIGGLRSLFSMADGSDTGRSILYFSGGILRTFIAGGTVTNPGGTVAPADTTCLYHMVYDADPDANPGTDDQEVRFYINGQLDGAIAVGTVAPNLGEWVLGSVKSRTAQYLNGWLDESAVFGSALSDARIADHATAFYAAADPLLGLVSDVTEITSGESVTLTWKISDLATAVTINGEAQTISGGGVYTTVLSPTADTTYTLEVSGPGGPFTSTVDVTVLLPPMITSITADDSTPPMITIVVAGAADTTYNVNASTNLTDDFPTNVSSVLTDGSGVGTTTFEGLGLTEYYRLETP